MAVPSVPPTCADLQRLLSAQGIQEAFIVTIVKAWMVRAREFDYYVVYALPSEQWLGLETPKENQGKTLTANIMAPPIRCDELYKFCGLLKDGDHTAVEALYIDAIYESEAWKELRKSRRVLARTKQVFNKYVGQPKRVLIEATPERPVHYVEIFRWLLEAQRLLDDREPRVVWPVSSTLGDAELAQLRAMASGSPDEMRQRASELVSSLTGKFTVPISADITLIQGWLVKLRKSILSARSG